MLNKEIQSLQLKLIGSLIYIEIHIKSLHVICGQYWQLFESFGDLYINIILIAALDAPINGNLFQSHRSYAKSVDRWIIDGIFEIANGFLKNWMKSLDF